MIVGTYDIKNLCILADRNNVHKAVQSMFGCQRAEHNVLYMVSNDGHMIIQSDVIPGPSDDLRVRHSKDRTEELNSIKNNDLVKIHTIVEPVKKVRSPGKRLGMRIALKSEDDRRQWVAGKLSDAGTIIAIVEQGRSRVAVTKDGKKHAVSLYGYDIVMKVKDAEAFKRIVQKGVGPSKAYGAGMLLLMGVQHAE